MKVLIYFINIFVKNTRLVFDKNVLKLIRTETMLSGIHSFVTNIYKLMPKLRLRIFGRIYV